MKTINVPQSGKLGDIVASKNHSGPYLRKHTPPRKKPTYSQTHSRGEFGAVAKAWGNLTDEQYQAWRARAAQEKSKPRLGKCYSLTGQTFFARINNPRSAFGRELLLDPPPRPQFGPNPVGRLILTNTGERVIIQLEVTGTPEFDIMVFGSRPRNRSVSRCFKYVRLGPLPDAENGLCDITWLFIRKHGKPAVGQRIFIRTRQQCDGGHDGFLEVNAVVPPQNAPSGKGKRQ
jgi:hypothetical protein